MKQLLCHRGLCDAACCGVLTPWEEEDYQRLIKAHHDIVRKKNLKLIKFIGFNGEIQYIFLPNTTFFSSLKRTIRTEELRKLRFRLECYEVARMEIKKCPFLDKNFRCQVYQFRPLACQSVGTSEFPCPKEEL